MVKRGLTLSVWCSVAEEIDNLAHAKNTLNKDKLAENASAADKFRERIANMGSDIIPDANKIHEARKKREEMRKMAEDPSYVSMSKKKKQKPKIGSRIEAIDSDEEEQITRLKG